MGCGAASEPADESAQENNSTAKSPDPVVASEPNQGLIGSGDNAGTLAGVLADFPACDAPDGLGSPTAAFDGDFAALLAARPELADQCRNTIKRCPNAACKKPCAVSVAACNGCNTSLDGVEVPHH